MKSFETYIIDLCSIAPIKHVAHLLGVSWALVKGIYKDHLRRRSKKLRLKEVRYIAVDEFATRKGHQYMTVVLNLSTGQILHVQEGKGAESLEPFLKKLRQYGAPLQAVAVDMSSAYVKAVEAVFPEVDIVHDPFHIVAMVNRAIDETRRDEYNKLVGDNRKVLKGSRFILLKGLETLQEPALDRLLQVMNLNRTLYQAYLLKEDLRMFWRMPNRKVGERFLDNWIAQANASGIKHFVKLAETLNKSRSRLLTYFKHRISTGPLEGLNNKIKVLKRQAYGFRDMAYFRLRLLFIHEDRLTYPG
jgi:transposase